MTSVFDEFIMPQQPAQNDITGTFICHECGEYVNYATKNTKTNKLSWVCSKKHVSVIEWNL